MEAEEQPWKTTFYSKLPKVVRIQPQYSGVLQSIMTSVLLLFTKREINFIGRICKLYIFYKLYSCICQAICLVQSTNIKHLLQFCDSSGLEKIFTGCILLFQELHAHLNGSISSNTIKKLIAKKPDLKIHDQMTMIDKGKRRTLEE